MDTSQLTQERFANLQRLYVASMPDKHAEITTYWILAEQQNWQGEVIDKLLNAIHRLARSGYSYGFSDISAVAHEIEGYLKSPLNKPEKILDINRTLQSLCSLLTVHSHEDKIRKNHSLIPQRWLTSHTNNHILFIADQNAYTQQVIRQLQDQNYTVDLLTDVSQVQSHLMHQIPSVIICDAANVNDKKTLKELHVIGNLLKEQLPTTPCIFISQQNDFTTRLKAVQAGAVAYLHTPVTTHQLLECLTEVLMLDQEKPYRLVLLEDDQDMANLYQAAFQQAGMEILSLQSAEDLISVLVEFQPEIILLDTMTTTYHSFDLATVIRQEDAYFNIPILFLTNEPVPNKRLSALGLGGDDYLNKSVSLEYLLHLVSIRVRKARKLQKLLACDGLTGFLTMHTFINRLTAQLAIGERSGSPVSVVAMDMDNFKQVNKIYGYWHGNYLLKQIAQGIKKRLRRGDLIGRYQGASFILALNNADLLSAKKVVEDLLHNIDKTIKKSLDNHLNLSISSGISYYPGHFHQEITHEKLIQLALKAMQESKQSGHNQITLMSLEDSFETF